MGHNYSLFKGDNRPVECISWDDAVSFCQRLSEQMGKQYRLPTEAEWEYASRAGTNTEYFFGDEITDKLPNYVGNVGEITPVGQYEANNFGLFDMHGNVWEWCEDDWHDDYENAPTDGTAWLSENEEKVIRGGAWWYDLFFCRSAYRSHSSRFERNDFIGCRVVCDLIS